MAEVMLASGQAALVDEADLPLVTGLKWHVHSVQNSNLRYARSWPYGNNSFMHRLITGATPGQHVDHANGDGLDNRRANIRICTHAQNMGNRSKLKNSGQPYKGIQFLADKFRTNPWKACIGKEQKYIGVFASAEEAARAYDVAAIARYGEFARLNFPSGGLLLVSDFNKSDREARNG